MSKGLSYHCSCIDSTFLVPMIIASTSLRAWAKRPLAAVRSMMAFSRARAYSRCSASGRYGIRSWQKPGAPCAVTFECNGTAGEPVTWTVSIAPQTIFAYWPSKTADDGTDADLQAALMGAGKTAAEARRRTTCEVFSPDSVTVRGYTRFGGDPTLIPVAVY